MDDFWFKVTIGVVLMAITTLVGNIKWQLLRFINRQDKQEDKINKLNVEVATRADISEVHVRIDDLGKTMDGKFSDMTKTIIGVIREKK